MNIVNQYVEITIDEIMDLGRSDEANIGDLFISKINQGKVWKNNIFAYELVGHRAQNLVFCISGTLMNKPRKKSVKKEEKPTTKKSDVKSKKVAAKKVKAKTTPVKKETIKKETIKKSPVKKSPVKKTTKKK